MPILVEQADESLPRRENHTTDMNNPCDQGFTMGVQILTPWLKFIVITAFCSSPMDVNKKYRISFVSAATRKTHSGIFNAGWLCRKPNC